MPRVPFEPVVLKPLSSPRAETGYRPSALEYAGQGTDALATNIRGLEQSYGVSEGARIARETSAAMQAGVKKAATQYADPLQFEEAANKILDDIQKGAREQSYSPRIGNYVSAQIGDDIALRKGDIATIKYGKMKVQAHGNWITNVGASMQQYANSEYDPEQRAKIAQDLGEQLNNFERSNLFEANDAAKERIDIAKRFTTIDIRRDYKNDPEKTLKELESSTGKYSKTMLPEEINQLKHSLATEYSVSRNLIRQAVKDDQDNNYADMMVQARSGKLTQETIDASSMADPTTGKRKIDAPQAAALTRQLEATLANGGLLYSDPIELNRYQFLAHRRDVNPDRLIQEVQDNRKITNTDKDRLFQSLEATAARQRAEASLNRSEALQREEAARRKITDAKLFDVSNTIEYQSAEKYLRSLPNTDRLDLDHQMRHLVGKAFVDFDQAVRSKDPEGNPKYKPQDYQRIAEQIHAGTLEQMGYRAATIRSKLLPGINVPADAALAARMGRISPQQLVEQMELFRSLGVEGASNPAPATGIQAVQPKPSVSRDEDAKNRAKAVGGAGVTK